MFKLRRNFPKKRRYVSYAKDFQAADTTPITRRRNRGLGPLTGLLKLLVLVGGAWAFVSFVGLPAILWEYHYLGPKEYRTDIACTHIRIDGTIHRSTPGAGQERCTLIAFFKTR